MNARQLSQQLSISEFSRLCACVDEKLPPSEEMVGGNGEMTRLAGRLIERKFVVIQLDRQADRIRAYLDLGKGFCMWVEFKPSARAA